MSIQKKNTQKKGFTLVEVIVVAVIVAILAAVAIPIYQQYVTDSKTNAANNAAGSIASFAGACNAASNNSIGTATPTSGAAYQCPGKTEISVMIPNDLTCTITAGSPGTVVCTNGDITSNTYNF